MCLTSLINCFKDNLLIITSSQKCWRLIKIIIPDAKQSCFKALKGWLSQTFLVSCPLAWALVLTKADLSSITLTEFQETDFFHFNFSLKLNQAEEHLLMGFILTIIEKNFHGLICSWRNFTESGLLTLRLRPVRETRFSQIEVRGQEKISYETTCWDRCYANF